MVRSQVAVVLAAAAAVATLPGALGLRMAALSPGATITIYGPGNKNVQVCVCVLAIQTRRHGLPPSEPYVATLPPPPASTAPRGKARMQGWVQSQRLRLTHILCILVLNTRARPCLITPRRAPHPCHRQSTRKSLVRRACYPTANSMPQEVRRRGWF